MEYKIFTTDKARLKDRIRYEPPMGLLVLVLRIREMYNPVTGFAGLSM